MSEVKDYLEVIEMSYKDEVEDRVIDVEVVENSNEDETYKKVDTSFKTYNEKKEEVHRVKRKNWFTRLISFCKKVLLLAIVVPMGIIIGGMTIGFTGMGFCIGVGAILAGVGVMGMAAFIVTAYSQIMGWLMVFVALGLISIGGLVLCIMTVIFRGLKRSVRWIRGYRRTKVEEK